MLNQYWPPFAWPPEIWALNSIFLNLFSMVLSLIPVTGMLGKDSGQGINRRFVQIACLNALFLLSDTLVRVLRLTAQLPAVPLAIAEGICFLLGQATLLTYGRCVLEEVGGLPGRPRALWHAVTVAGALFAALALLGLRINAANPLPWLPSLVPALLLSCSVSAILCLGRRLNKRHAFSMALGSVILAAPVLLSHRLPEVCIAGIASGLSLLILYVSIQGEQSRTLWQKELDLSQSSVALMMSQMQPHFMYNSLLAISQLCDTSPVEASEMVSKFSQYLRVNVDSLQQYAPIPFQDELDHVMIYLYIEQKRFEEKLRIDLDIAAVGFRVPALSLQPIVENAVRHGVTKRESGGVVRICTQDAGACWRVTVEDNGIGFDPAEPLSAERSHLGIENVRTRLASVSGGTLHIQSTPGEGTKATITIPKGGIPA